MDPDQTQSGLSPHCLPINKNRFKKFARLFSRRHKQTTFSDAGCLGALRVKTVLYIQLRYKLLLLWRSVSFKLTLSSNYFLTVFWMTFHLARARDHVRFKRQTANKLVMPDAYTLIYMYAVPMYGSICDVKHYLISAENISVSWYAQKPWFCECLARFSFFNYETKTLNRDAKLFWS